MSAQTPSTRNWPPTRAPPRICRRTLAPASGQRLHKLSAYLALDALQDSYRVVRACMRSIGCHPSLYHADGSLVRASSATRADRTKRMYDLLTSDIARLRQNGVSRRLPSRHEQLTFEHLLAYLNSHGITPVVVTNPLQPQLLAELDRQGTHATGGRFGT